MIVKNIECIIEGVLFSAGGVIPLASLAQLIELDVMKTREIVEGLMKKYETEKRGIKIIELDGGFQMCSNDIYYDYIQKLAPPKRQTALSASMLETLSVVAYNQPVTRATVEYIRGVNSDYAINRLLERELICESGRLDTPGKPILFSTTQEFLRCFGLKDLTELPHIEISDKLLDTEAMTGQVEVSEIEVIN